MYHIRHAIVQNSPHSVHAFGRRSVSDDVCGQELVGGLAV